MTVALAEDGSNDKPYTLGWGRLVEFSLNKVLPIWAYLKFNEMIKDLTSITWGIEPACSIHVYRRYPYMYEVTIHFYYYDGTQWFDDYITLVITK